MVGCGLAFFLGRHPAQACSPPTRSPRRRRTLLTFAAVYQFFDALYIIYNGALRGAGDTLVPAVVTGVLCWGITVVGGYLASPATSRALGPGGPWLVATAYGVILGVVHLHPLPPRGLAEHPSMQPRRAGLECPGGFRYSSPDGSGGDAVRGTTRFRSANAAPLHRLLRPDDLLRPNDHWTDP